MPNLRNIAYFLALISWMGSGLAVARPGSAADSPDDIYILLDQIGPACLKARKASELEDLQAQLNQFEPQNYSQNLGKELAGGKFLLDRWKLYLKARDEGNLKVSKRVLDDLLSTRNWQAFLPRSKVIELRREEGKKEKLSVPPMIPCETWSDLPAAIQILTDYQNALGGDDDIRVDLDALKELQQVALKIDEGNWEAVMNGCFKKGSDVPVLQCFQQYLIAKAVVGYLNLDAKYQREPKPGESGLQFLAAAEKKARKDRDWISLWRIITFQQSLNRGLTPLSEVSGLDLYLTGLELEKLGREDEAMLCYRKLLVQPVDPAIVKDIGEKFRDFQKKSPAQWLVIQDKMPVFCQISTDGEKGVQNRPENGFMSMNRIKPLNPYEPFSPADPGNMQRTNMQYPRPALAEQRLWKIH